MQKQKIIASVLGSSMAALLAAPPASAGLISSVSYDQVASAEDSALNGHASATQSLIGSTLPVSQTLTATGTEGCSITANYHFTDSGTLAAFNISSIAVLTLIGQAGEEGTRGNASLTFLLSQPAIYSMNFSSTLSPGIESSNNITLNNLARLRATVTAESAMSY